MTWKDFCSDEASKTSYWEVRSHRICIVVNYKHKSYLVIFKKILFRQQKNLCSKLGKVMFTFYKMSEKVMFTFYKMLEKVMFTFYKVWTWLFPSLCKMWTWLFLSLCKVWTWLFPSFCSLISKYLGYYLTVFLVLNALVIFYNDSCLLKEGTPGTS